MIRRAFITSFCLTPLLVACTSAGGIGSKSRIQKPELNNSQPRYATFDCGNGRSLVVENMQTSVIVVPPRGESVELLASPPNSRTRYSVNQDTLVLDKRTAFWFRTGSQPLDCKR